MDQVRGQFPRHVAAAALAAWLIASAPAGAQEAFELGEEGFERTAAPDPGTPEGELHAVRAALAEDRAKDAERLATEWIGRHPDHPRLDEAYLLRGDAKAARDQLYNALFDYEVVLRSFPGSEHFQTVLERELAIAEAFARGVRRRLLGLRVLPAHETAEEILIRIQERSPGSRLAERAGIELADFYYRRARMELAAEAYDLFVRNYPDSQWLEHAMQRQVLANLATFRGGEFDATGLFEARSRLRDYEQAFPAAAEQIGAEPLVTRIDETLADRQLGIGRWYEGQGERVSAAFTYRRLIQDYPGTVAAQRALGRLRELDPRMSQRFEPVDEED